MVLQQEVYVKLQVVILSSLQVILIVKGTPNLYSNLIGTGIAS